MKLTRSLIATGLLAMTASAASAQVRQDSLKLTAAYATWRSSGVVANGVYVGPYQARFKNGGFSSPSPSFDVFCVDFQNGISVGQKWGANITTLAGSDMTKTRWKNQLKYQKAAYLSAKFATTSTTKWGALHAAIWNVMAGSPSITSGSWSSADAQAFYTDAQANGGNFDMTNWFVITDVNTSGATPGVGGVQEYLYNTPEPATLILLGTGLLTLVLTGVIRKQMA
jgi:hypothetical protein